MHDWTRYIYLDGSLSAQAMLTWSIHTSATMENKSRTTVPSLSQEIRNLFLQDEIRIIEPFLPKTMKDFNSSCFCLIVILGLALKVDYIWSAWTS